MCNVPRLPAEVFETLHFLPDPILSESEEGHYQAFHEVYGKPTTEKDRPSTKKSSTTHSRRYTLKHIKNANLMLQCEECEFWRLLYSETQLTREQKMSIQNSLTDCVFTCGSNIEDAHLDVEGIVVYTMSLNCFEPIEKQYYSAGYAPICVYCASDVPRSSLNTTYLPQCDDCKEKEPISKR